MKFMNVQFRSNEMNRHCPKLTKLRASILSILLIAETDDALQNISVNKYPYAKSNYRRWMKMAFESCTLIRECSDKPIKLREKKSTIRTLRKIF